MNPRISIIVPVYNSEEYIRDTLQAIENQDYPELELILINDGSTDTTFDIISKFEFSHVSTVILNEKNSGVSNSRNKGIKISTGKYITFVDADDLIEPDFISELVCQSENKNLVIAKNIHDYVNQQPKPWSANSTNLLPIEENRFFVYVWGKLYLRQHVLDNKLLFAPYLRVGEDFCFNIHYLISLDNEESIKVVDNQAKFLYRVIPTSLSHNVSDSAVRNRKQSALVIFKLLSRYRQRDTASSIYYSYYLKRVVLNAIRDTDLSRFHLIIKMEAVDTPLFFRDILNLNVDIKQKIFGLSIYLFISI
ncbi:glycosyltransferase family 2 protein, partial [Vibrio sp. 10N.261.45.F1]